MRLVPLVNKNVIFLCAAIFAFMMISFATPPMQSPDEGAHFKRSAMLTHGVIIMGHEDGLRSGGNISVGLDNFIRDANSIGKGGASSVEGLLNKYRWEDETRYSIAYNTAYNFPLVYLPQAVSLFIGEALNIRISDTYYLARVITFACSMIILSAAWSIYRFPTPVIALLILPMAMFQLASPVLDSITISLTVLMMCIYCQSRIKDISIALFLTLSLCCFLISTSKANMLPVCALPFFTRVSIRLTYKYLIACLPLIMSILWIIIALSNTNDAGVHHPGYSQGDVMKYYIKNPVETLLIVFNTITDATLIDFYYRSFIGVLGPLDVFLSNNHYNRLSLLFIAAIALAILTTKQDSINYAALVISICSIGLIFCALLVQWSEFPAVKINGIQGRYFICPTIILLFCFSESKFGRIVNKRITLPVIFFASLYASVTSLISFYS
ncbi:DUF2142 domain-containing protein [Escherichia coli]|uniref:DUF2142 domain-containing protein n=1 Tax=Escherichia coli TaxID=562 RepID=UPI0008550C9D|nr:DUF2142 domain-containing protein [Escherichia coli]OEN44588.1 hypothetical protein BHF47_02375 [Escherichia coli]